ncbi:ATPase, partial [Micromonospora aurantiaca]|nr:ATPase [Micromonospora aurantiaca]
LARRRRESRVDEILAGARGERVAVDTPTAAASVRPGGAGRSAA